MDTIPTDIDFNVMLLKEYADSLDVKTESGVRYQIKKFESLNMIKVHPKIPLNKTISFQELMDGKTGYLTVDRFSNDIRDKHAESTSELLKSLNVRNIERLNFLNGKTFLITDDESKHDRKYLELLKGIIKQLGLITALLFYKETGMKLDYMCDPEVLSDAIVLEMQRRNHYIKDYFIKISQPDTLKIENWPVKRGIVKSANMEKQLGYITSEDNLDLFFPLGEISFAFKVGDRVEFNLPILKNGNFSNKAVFVRLPTV